MGYNMIITIIMDKSEDLGRFDRHFCALMGHMGWEWGYSCGYSWMLMGHKLDLT